MPNSQAGPVVGGGDSAAPFKEPGLVSKMSHGPPAAGASLEFVEVPTLPGIQALEE